MATKRGIDVSSHNGQVDWAKAKAAGLDFAILRCGWGVDRASQDDSTFARNVSECDRLGIPWGAYLYSYAMNIEEAKSEAEHIKRLLKGKRPLYPVIIDMEDADGYKAQRGGNTRQMNTDIIKTVCHALEGAGYYAMWYANRDWCINYINTDQLSNFDFWYARPGLDEPDKPCGIWQDGIGGTGSSWPGANNGAGYCDTNIAYRDYPAVIEAAGLNGWGGEVPDPAPRPEPERKTKYKLGQKVTFSTCYRSSSDTTDRAISAADMARNCGVITRILPEARQPYLLDNGLCWVNDGGIRSADGMSADTPAGPTGIREGDRVRVRRGARSYEGASIAPYVYDRTYSVDELRGERAVLDKGGICTAFRLVDLERA